MVANEPPIDPEQSNSETSDKSNEPEEVQDSLLRGLGTPKEKPKKEVAAPQSEEDILNDRLSAFLEETEKSPEQNEPWLNNFWNNEVSDDEKRRPSGDELEADTSSSPDISSQVMDDYLYEEWKRISGNSGNPAQEPPVTPSKIFDFSTQESEEVPLNHLPEPREFDFLEGIEEPTPPEELDSIFTLPVDRSHEALVEMRSLIQDDAPHSSEVFIDKDRPVQAKKRKTKLTRLEVFLISFIVLLTLATASIVIRSIYFPAHVQEPASTAGPSVIVTAGDILPTPHELIMTGGWSFPLNKNTLVDGQWKPRGPEWLADADVSRIVALPWNAQLEAIVHSLNPGDSITLVFNNQTEIKYKVQKSEQIAVTDAELMNSTTPSLIIILYGQDSPSRWVITCLP
jgi:hypothetical protein